MAAASRDRYRSYSPGSLGGRRDGHRASDALGKPVLIQPASAGYYGEAGELSRTKGARLLRRAILANTGFAAISAEIDREWRALGVPERRMIRMASGVDTERFRPGASDVEAELLPRPRVIFTGRLHPQKNLPLLLEAWTEVARRSPANLILVGPGNDREQLTELAAALGISDRVQFVGARRQPGRLLTCRRLFCLAERRRGNEQLAPGSHGNRPPLRCLRELAATPT